MTSENMPIPAPAGVLQVDHAPQAASDAEMVELWLRLREDKRNTYRAYANDVRAFVRFVDKPLRSVTVRDMQDFKATLSGYAPATAVRRLAAVKSLIGFAHRVGYVAFDVGAPIQLAAPRNRLAERILDEASIYKLFAAPMLPHETVLLRFLYYSGARASEACGAQWRDLTPRDGAGQIALHGKGDKSRFVLLPAKIYGEVTAMRGRAKDDAPIFPGRRGAPLDPVSVWRVVKSAAKRARLSSKISPHTFRHCHASHALDRNCPISLVQATLGHASVATTGLYLHARPGDSSARYLPA
jgi:integrase/recombinase XerD